jgi:hypothetical protein
MSEVIIAWWSAGVTSAVATKLAIQEFGTKIKPVYFQIDSAHQDNKRFKEDCENWYGMEIEVRQASRFKDQFDVIEVKKYINGPAGARCTVELKKNVRHKVEKEFKYSGQIFGFEYSKREVNRAVRFKEQHPSTNPIFPLIEAKMTKPECLYLIEKANIKIPEMYQLGYSNNNCIGCVKGGIGYWNKIRVDFPDVFNRMSSLERKLNRHCLKEGYLDEIDSNRGHKQKIIMPDCGNFCDLEFEDLDHPRLNEIFEDPLLLRRL